MIRRRLVVSGRVQGVSYRAWLSGEALARHLVGWVRNRSDGTVEAVVEGAAADVDTLIAAARVGPSAARVAHVALADADPGEPLAGFVQRATL